MIPFDFEYYKPQTAQEAYACMTSLKASSKKAFYYSGGTELVTLLRKEKIVADAIIDLKGISEMCRISNKEDFIVVGTCVSMNKAIEFGISDLIHTTFEKVADHTVRNALTVGGNLCGRLPFKEALLPLIALKAIAVVYGENGPKEIPLSSLFDKRLKLKADEFLYEMMIPHKMPEFTFAKRVTAGTAVDYPLIHLVATSDGEHTTVVLSGFANYPVFKVLPAVTTADQWMTQFEGLAKHDERGSASYRKHLLKVVIDEMMEVYPYAGT